MNGRDRDQKWPCAFRTRGRWGDASREAPPPSLLSSLVLDLAIAMASYTGGALIAGFFLAFLRGFRSANGYPWAAALSVLSVFCVVWHEAWAFVVVATFSAVFLFTCRLTLLDSTGSGIQEDLDPAPYVGVAVNCFF